jgi:hypothetical protein
MFVRPMTRTIAPIDVQIDIFFNELLPVEARIRGLVIADLF